MRRFSFTFSCSRCVVSSARSVSASGVGRRASAWGVEEPNRKGPVLDATSTSTFTFISKGFQVQVVGGARPWAAACGIHALDRRAPASEPGIRGGRLWTCHRHVMDVSRTCRARHAGRPPRRGLRSATRRAAPRRACSASRPPVSSGREGRWSWPQLASRKSSSQLLLRLACVSTPSPVLPCPSLTVPVVCIHPSASPSGSLPEERVCVCVHLRRRDQRETAASSAAY